MAKRRVVVIGGGLSGITAALECADKGAEVTLLEARGRLGGAAYSYERDGLSVDNGQHVFLRCCSSYQGLLERMQATAMVNLQPRLQVAVIAPGGRLAWLRRSGLPAPLHLAASMIRYPFLTLGERVAVARTMQKLRRVDYEDPRNDERSFGDWLREHGQSNAAVEAVWELIARPTINLTADDASLAQAAQVFRLGLLQDAAAGDIGWAVRPLSEIHDQAARRALERAGVEVRLRSTTKAIEPGSYGDHGDEPGIRVQASDGFTAIADAVVLAVAPTAAEKLLPEQAGIDRRFAEHLGSSPIVNLHIVYDRPVLDQPFAAGVQSPVQWIFDRTASSGLKSGQYITVSLSAADGDLGASAEELRGRYLPALTELLPKARDATVENFFVSREHAATFRAAPGARQWRPGPRTALPGLVLAGAWTDTGWPATMEGAVRSGSAAAAEAMQAMSQRGARQQSETSESQQPRPVGVMR